MSPVKRPVDPRSLGLAAVVAATLWFSISSPLVKWADAPGPTLAFWRMVVAIIGWWTVLLIHRARTGYRLPSAATWRRVAPAGLLFGGNLAIFFSAIRLTSVAHAEFIGSLAPLALLPLGALLFHEHPNWRSLRWGAISLIGVAIVILGGTDSGTSSLRGDAMMLFALTLWVGYMLATKWARQQQISTMHFMACAVPTSMLAVAPLMLFADRSELLPPTPRAWAVVVILAILTGIGAHGLIVFAQKSIPVATIGIMQVAQPALASLWAWALLGEAIALAQVPGMVLVIGGLLMFTISSQRRTVTITATPAVPAPITPG